MHVRSISDLWVSGVDPYLVSERLQYPFDLFHRGRLQIDRMLALHVLITLCRAAEELQGISCWDDCLSNENGRMAHHRLMSVTTWAKTVAGHAAAAWAILAWQ